MLPVVRGARAAAVHAARRRLRAHGRAARARRGAGRAPRVRARRAAVPRHPRAARRHAAREPGSLQHAVISFTYLTLVFLAVCSGAASLV